jgi:SAM-dependent methyltransferase
VKIHAFGDLPLADKLRESISVGKVEQKFPLTLVYCQACKLLQIRETVVPDILFGDDYPYYSSVSDRWLEHCAINAAELIDRYDLGEESLVVELAANDGYMLRNFHEQGIPTLGIDPAPGPVAAARALGIPMQQEFFGLSVAERLVAEGQRADVIIANNVLAHVADLESFIAGIGRLLAEDGVAVFEVPYVRDLMDRCEFDTIYHEHLCYFSMRALCDVFARRNLCVVDAMRLPTHGGSLRVYVRHDGWPTHELEQLRQEEDASGLNDTSRMHEFSTQTLQRQQELRAAISDLRQQGKTIAAYGAAAKGAMLLNMCDIPADWIDYVVDRNIHKHGKLMPGLDVPICSADRLSSAPVDSVLLLAWNLAEEIAEQQADYLREGGQFLLPIPGCPIINGHQKQHPLESRRNG